MTASTDFRWLFDGRQLRRWSIDERRLPSESIVSFRDPSVWERYRWPLVGIGLALAAVVLVSRVEGETSGSSGLRYALVAGCGLGLFNVLIAQVTPGLVFGPLAILRATQALIIVGFVVVAGASLPPSEPFGAFPPSCSTAHSGSATRPVTARPACSCSDLTAVRVRSP